MFITRSFLVPIDSNSDVLFVCFTFSRRFYPKRLTVHSDYTCFCQYVFPGNRTHNILRCWRNALPLSHTGRQILFYTLKVMQQLFGYQYCSQYILLHSTAEGNPYRIRKTTEFSFWGEIFLESMQPNIQYLLLPFLSIMWIKHQKENV